MQRSDFHYDLPPELIAQTPQPRGASRLLVVDEPLRHQSIGDLPELLRAGDLLVVNDSRVIKARLRGSKDTGGAVEILVERIESEFECLAQVRSSKPLLPGRRVRIADAAAGTAAGTEIEMIERDDRFFRLRASRPIEALLEAHGDVPLPPYIERASNEADEERYQTVYADAPGSVAAPTAGLHFDDALLARLAGAGVEQAKVTLHVGAGTFTPVRSDDLDDHVMHTERFQLDADCVEAIQRCRARSGRVIAVGTTVVRVLETVAAEGNLSPCAGETALFIKPGYEFQVVDGLLTNFHLPESTLLMLVSAFAGTEPVRKAYQQAVEARYRFFSYGDAMLCYRHESSDEV